MRLGLIIPLVLFTAAPVMAQSGELPADAPEAARMRYKVGRHLYKQSRFQEAAAEFEAGLAMHPTSSRLAYNLGRSRERTGDRVRSRRIGVTSNSPPTRPTGARSKPWWRCWKVPICSRHNPARRR